MKIFKKIAILFVVTALLLSAFVFPASAAKSAVIYFNKTSVEVGDKVTITVSVNPGEEMYAVSFYLEYDDEVLKYESGTGVAKAGVLQVVESPSGDKSVKYNFTFSAIKVGSSSISVRDCVYDVLGSNGAETKTFGGASARLTVKDLALSGNAKLKSLKVSGYSLSPTFSSGRTSYSLKVPNNVTKLNISATPEDSKAKVTSVTGNKLNVGVNTVTITVQAENGTQKKYTIKVTRADENESEEDETENTETALDTNINGMPYTIVTKLPEDVIFKGFSVETTKLNGYDIETAVDMDGIYRIFYLQAAESDKLTPYLYNEELDSFEPLKYTTQNNKLYIFSQIPDDFEKPDSLYEANIDINGFTIPCLSDTNGAMSEFHYVYAFTNGIYNLYRYDSFEGTLQRQPDFEFTNTVTVDEDDSFTARFASLSTNAKVILVGLVIVVLGVLALLVLLIVYLFRRSVLRNEDMILGVDDMYFDEVEHKKDDTKLK